MCASVVCVPRRLGWPWLTAPSARINCARRNGNERRRAGFATQRMSAMGTVERAYQLAPECRTMDELRSKLSREHCANIDAHLQGSLRRELRKLLISETAP